MKTFLDFLNEMSLKSYRHDLMDRQEKEEEFYTDPRTGKKDLGNQISSATQNSIVGKFSKKDRIIITHPRTFRQLEEKLSKSEFDFNILMIEDRRVVRVLDDKYREQVEEFMKSNGIQKEGHITFVKNGTSGHVLTPWMILHTLGHALTFQEEKTKQKIRDRLEGIALNISANDDVQKFGFRTFGDVFLFISASAKGQHNTSKNMGELTHELIAEFLWHGDRIRIKPPYNERPYIIKEVKYIEDEIRGLLRSLVGEIIYDYY